MGEKISFVIFSSIAFQVMNFCSEGMRARYEQIQSVYSLSRVECKMILGTPCTVKKGCLVKETGRLINSRDGKTRSGEIGANPNGE